MRKILVLGSTGSVGCSTMEVLRYFKDRVKVTALAAGGNVDLLRTQIKEFKPQAVSLRDVRKLAELRKQFPEVSFFAGENAAVELIESLDKKTVEVVIAAIGGIAGLKPTWTCLQKGWRLGLANKESLVTAGELFLAEAAKNQVEIIPVDSEHSAIWQCLLGEKKENLAKIILTCSGGPFFGKLRSELRNVPATRTLKHPTWKMGSKISVDSATLMNKGLEVIEAHHLFGVDYDEIEIMIHRQSYIHSLIELRDGTQLAQLSKPDMKLPIQLTMSYPERWPSEFVKNDLISAASLTFERPDEETFGCLKLAIEAGKTGRSASVILNAANEIAVIAHLTGKIDFLGIEKVVEFCLERIPVETIASLDQVLEIDQETRKVAENYVNQIAS